MTSGKGRAANPARRNRPPKNPPPRSHHTAPNSVILTKVRTQSPAGQRPVTLDPDFRQDDGLEGQGYQPRPPQPPRTNRRPITPHRHPNPVILTKVRIQSQAGQRPATLDPDFRQDDGRGRAGPPTPFNPTALPRKPPPRSRRTAPQSVILTKVRIQSQTGQRLTTLGPDFRHDDGGGAEAGTADPDLPQKDQGIGQPAPPARPRPAAPPRTPPAQIPGVPRRKSR